MSTCACVLSKNGERLMPTIRLGKVRHLLKDGKAKIIKHHPFTIQLLYDSETNIQPIEICEDVGYNYIGISVKSQSHEYVSARMIHCKTRKAVTMLAVECAELAETGYVTAKSALTTANVIKAGLHPLLNIRKNSTSMSLKCIAKLCLLRMQPLKLVLSTQCL